MLSIRNRIAAMFFLSVGCCIHNNLCAESNDLNARVINDIHIVRKNPNKYLTQEAIQNFIPFKKGLTFETAKTNAVIKRLYNLGYFEHIAIRADRTGTDKINLFVMLDELPEVVDIELTGNDNLSDTKIEQELKLSQLRAVNQHVLNIIVKKLKKLYQEKDYHLVDIDTKINIIEGNKAVVVITIKENARSYIKRVLFKGNKSIQSKELKRAIFSREDWLFGFVSKAGSYQPDKFEKDKRLLESYYRTLGYMNAKVTAAHAVMNPVNKHYTVTFTIEEGELYHVSDVHVQGNDNVSEQTLLHAIPLKAGAIYSLKDIIDSMDAIKNALGEFGYLFVDVQPNIVPNEAAKTVDISFDVDLGKKVYLNRLIIKGNRKTRDYVIRRKINLNEGDLISRKAMETSKQRVEAMSFWDRDEGVVWKPKRVNDHQADLELIVKEAKTGKIMGQIGYGGNPMNQNMPATGFSWTLNIHDINLAGKGIIGSAGFSWSHDAWVTNVDFSEPYFMDYPVGIGGNFHVSKVNRSEELTSVNNLTERMIGSTFHVGYTSTRWPIDTVFRGIGGFENIALNHPPRVVDDCRASLGAIAYQKVLNQEFQNGTTLTLTGELGQDCRNHVMHPSGGFQWSFIARLGFPISTFAFLKFEGDYSWYTSLIDEYGLVLGVHAHAGYVRPVDNRCIPYSELYNIGGAASVRGFEWGEISPSFNLNPTQIVCDDWEDGCGHCNGNSIGGRKAFYVNLELTFPLRKDYSLKGAFFYDGGSGWCPPCLPLTQAEYNTFVYNKNFDYRQCVGVGIRMLSPQNLSIDWGFKLDRRPGECPYAVQFGMVKEF